MSEVGRLSAALTLDGANEFQRKLADVGRTFTDTANKGTAFGRLGEAAVRQAAGATTALTAAGGAYLTILAKTGGAYNSLQQNSRAALGVLLGGTEAANAQMDKLDAFARNSPFSKSLFIDAQQQMLGFGIETQKVIPYLDAIQNAVAATGGNSNKISELSTIFSQIQSSAKITAGDLREFGNRGVDAASMIGEQMGKTAAEIREDVSKGAIDAQTALDALAKGMEQTYGGTTERVKEQWTGAVDRVKAANRDIGAIIAEPFIAKNGGGMAVEWGNQVADVLRAVEKQAGPVMDIFMTRGGGLFAGIYEGLDRAQQSIERFNPDQLNVGLDKLAGHAPAIAATTGALLALGGQVGPLGRLFGGLGLTINPVVGAFAGLLATSPEVRDAFGDVLEAGAPLVDVAGELVQILSGGLTTVLPVVADGISLVAGVAGPLIDLVSQIPAPVLLGVGAFVAMHRAACPLQGTLSGVADGLRGLAARGAGVAVAEAAGGIGNLGSASDIAKGGVLKLGDAMKTAFLSNPIGIALTVVSAAVGLWAAANAEAQQKIEDHKSRVAELKETLDGTTGALTEATRAQSDKQLADTNAAELAKEIGVSYEDMKDAVLGNEDAYKRVTSAVDAYSATMTTGNEQADTWNATFMDGQKKVRDFNEILEAHRSSIEDAQAAKREAIQAEQEHNAAMSDSERATQRMNDALSVARDTTQDTTTRVNALKQALDELKGGQLSAEEAAKALSRANLDLAEGLAQTDEAGTKLWQSMLDGAGSIDLSTRQGLDFADAMGRSRDAMLDASLAAFDQANANGDLAGATSAAQKAGEDYVATLQQTMRDAGLTEEQIAGLTEKYLDVPATVATVLNSEGFTEVEAQIVDILNQLTALPEGTTITVENPGGQETIDKLRELGYAVEENPDTKEITITALGADAAKQQLEDLAGTTVPEKVFQVDAETGNALAEIDGVQRVRIDGKTAYVYGNNADAQQKIEEVLNNSIPAKWAVITGEDSDFWTKWAWIKAQAAIQKSVEIITRHVSVGSANDFAGGMYGPGGQHFAAGGFASGIYRGVMGGIPKLGVDGRQHIFAEKELGVPWETYISGNPAYRDRNIALLLETARRLSFPVIPMSRLAAVPQARNFAAGGTVEAAAPMVSMQSQTVGIRRERRRGRSGMLAEQIVIGADATSNDMRNAVTHLGNLIAREERRR
ncbi:tape measure protein [Leucobacter sp. USCH14]|uniref:tape measure protein n=1 Tax=Leucobacter sp. USCH14 TaxID=3024838 RepID=UPI0030999B0A